MLVIKPTEKEKRAFMKRFTLCVVTLLSAFVFLLPFPAMALWGVTPENYVTFKAGVYTPTGDLDDADFDSGFNGEVVFGHYFGQNFALEGGIGYFETKSSQVVTVSFFDPFTGAFLFDAPGDLDLSVSVVPLTVTAKGVIPAKPAEFYFGAGVGAYFERVEADLNSAGETFSEDDNDTVFGVHLVAGVNFDLNEVMFLGVEGKYIVTDEAEASFFGDTLKGDLNGFTVTGNLGFRF